MPVPARSVPASTKADGIPAKTAPPMPAAPAAPAPAPQSTPSSSSGVDLKDVEKEIRQKLIARQQELLKEKVKRHQEELDNMKRKLKEAGTPSSPPASATTAMPPVAAKAPSKEELQLKNALDKPKNTDAVRDALHRHPLFKV